MYCNHCGNILPDNASFCSFCGAQCSLAKVIPVKPAETFAVSQSTPEVITENTASDNIQTAYSVSDTNNEAASSTTYSDSANSHTISASEPITAPAYSTEAANTQTTTQSAYTTGAATSPYVSGYTNDSVNNITAGGAQTAYSNTSAYAGIPADKPVYGTAQNEIPITPSAEKFKVEKYYTFGHIMLCLGAVALMAIVAGVFAGLYFSVI